MPISRIKGLLIILAFVSCGVRESRTEWCQLPRFEASEEVVDSIYALAQIQEFPDEASWYLSDYLLTHSNPERADLALQYAVDEYGGTAVTYWLVRFISSHPVSGTGAYFRWKAAALYGFYHSLYPQFAPATLLPAMMANPRNPDEVREGFVLAARYMDTDPDLTEALSALLCQTAFHLRPFVHRPSDFYSGRNTMHWHRSALSLFEELVYTLAVRPGGRDVIDAYLETEPNKEIVRQVREWAENPCILPMFPGETVKASKQTGCRQ